MFFLVICYCGQCWIQMLTSKLTFHLKDVSVKAYPHLVICSRSYNIALVLYKILFNMKAEISTREPLLYTPKPRSSIQFVFEGKMMFLAKTDVE